MRFNYRMFLLFKLGTIGIVGVVIFSTYVWMTQYQQADVPWLMIAPGATVVVILLGFMAWMWLAVTAPKKRLLDELRLQCKVALKAAGRDMVEVSQNTTGSFFSVSKYLKTCYRIKLADPTGKEVDLLLERHNFDLFGDHKTPLNLTPSEVSGMISMLVAFSNKAVNTGAIEIKAIAAEVGPVKEHHEADDEFWSSLKQSAGSSA